AARRAAGPAAGARPRTGLPVLTLDRFEQAMQVAKLGAENSMHGLSFRAARESLKAGPPVVPMTLRAGNQPMMRISPSNEAADPVTLQVRERLLALDRIWEQQKAPAADVYEALREAVLPKARPGEIFIYSGPLVDRSTGVVARVPRGGGQILVRWAVLAGRADELRGLVEERKKQP